MVEVGMNNEWDTIIWSDESRFLLFENDGQQWVWRRPHEKYDVDCLVPTVKRNGEGVMVWGCFVKNRPGPLVVLEGNITGQVYKKLLEDHLLKAWMMKKLMSFNMIMLLFIELTQCLPGKRKI